MSQVTVTHSYISHQYQFKDLMVGDWFLFVGELYIKMELEQAINVKTGKVKCFHFDDMIYSVDVHIEYMLGYPSYSGGV